MKSKVMETLKWRSRAKVVAILDMAFATISLVIAIATAVAAVFSSLPNEPHEQISDEDVPFDETGELIMLIVTIISFMLVLTVIRFWAALKLLSATKQDRDLNRAITEAKIWGIVTISLLIMGTVLVLILKRYLSFAIMLIERFTFLYVVHKFVRELFRLLEMELELVDWSTTKSCSM